MKLCPRKFVKNKRMQLNYTVWWTKHYKLSPTYAFEEQWFFKNSLLKKIDIEHIFFYFLQIYDSYLG